MATRRRRGEDGISFEHRGPCRDPQRHRHCPGLWRGELTLGYTPDGKRQRRKVSGQTKAAVVDKLRDLHTQLDKGITPKAGYVHYTIRQAAEDWLAHGLDGRYPRYVPRPIRRGVPHGCASRLYTASMAFTLISGARHSLPPPEDGTSNDAAGFASCCGPHRRSPQRGF